MNINIISKEEQAYGEFNGGEIIENKPIGFPQDGGRQKPYSNLFYWAHASAEKESLIGLHPHRGFEIMSVVLEGEMEHYDTSDEKWSPLKAGDVQLIRAGNGISHAEKMKDGSQMFQIWFDPGLQKTLAKKASYDNYFSKDFSLLDEAGMKTRIIKDEMGPVQMDTEGVEIKEYSFDKGDHALPAEKEKIYSMYLITGNISLEGKQMKKRDFAIVEEADVELKIRATDKCKLFVISSPARLNYQSYFELSGW
ncbi:MAG: pirin family protein [Bacteroidota bacterium]|nr:pirin family protein [Bacteroidota bacterium]